MQDWALRKKELDKKSKQLDLLFYDNILASDNLSDGEVTDETREHIRKLAVELVDIAVRTGWKPQ